MIVIEEPVSVNESITSTRQITLNQLSEEEKQGSTDEIIQISMKTPEHQKLAYEIDRSTKLALIKTKFIECSRASSSHGYPNIFRTNKRPVKVFWFCFLLISITICSYLCIASILEYLEFKTNSKIEIIYECPTAFPAVSICHSSPFTAENVTFFLHGFVKNISDDETRNYLLKLFQKNATNLTTHQEIDAYRSRVEKLQYILKDPNISDDIRKTIGLSKSDLLFTCLFGKEKCIYEDIRDFYYSAYGNCYTFNSGISANGTKLDLLSLAEPSLLNGLVLNMFASDTHNQANSILTIDNTYGLRISISNQSYFNSFVDEQIPIRTGTCTYIGIKKTVTERLPTPYSNCKIVTPENSEMYNEFNKNNFDYQVNF